MAVTFGEISYSMTLATNSFCCKRYLPDIEEGIQKSTDFDSSRKQVHSSNAAFQTVGCR